MPKVDVGMRIFTVIDVWRGHAVGAYSFRRVKDARLCAKRLRKGRDLNCDDIRVYETVIDPPINDMENVCLDVE